MEKLFLKARGLSTYSNPMERAPGSLKEAENIVIDKDGLFSPRRGFERLDGAIPTASPALDMLVYQDTLIIRAGTALYQFNESTGAFTQYSGITVDAGTRVRTAESNGSLFLTGSDGVLKLDVVSGTMTSAGVDQGLDGQATAATATGGFLGNGEYASYRVVWGIKDANNKVNLGAPSSPILASNGLGGDGNVYLDFTVPDDITTSHFYQVYRTAVASSVDTGDECNLVYEDTYAEYAVNTITSYSDGSDTIDTTTDHGWATGTTLVLTTTGTLPGGISPGTFYAIVVDSNTIKLATTKANAFAGTAVTLNATPGSGTHTITPTNGNVIIYDQTPDELRNTAQGLYTNSLLEGAESYNTKPPKAVDIALFNGYMFYANLTDPHTYTFTLLATGGTNGLDTADQITVTRSGSTTLTYTAAAAEDVAAHNFLLQKASGSPAVDIRQTAESLVRCINRDSTNDYVYAYYDSGYGEMPGQIRIVEREPGGTAITVRAIGCPSTAFSPDISKSPYGVSEAETTPHGLQYSKFEQADSCPVNQRELVGSRSNQILRIAALRDALFILSEGGVYRLTGTSPSNFNVELLDNTTKLIAPGSVTVLNNTVWGLFDQGVCRISESGVEIVSREIEGEIKSWIGSHLANLKSQTFAVNYETDRKYILWVPTYASTTYPDTAYVYNTITDSWTTMDRAMSTALVNPTNDRLYACPELAYSGSYYLSKERKDFTFRDFADEQIDVTVSSISGTDITLASAVGVEVNDIFYQTYDVATSTVDEAWTDGDFVFITAQDGTKYGVYLDYSGSAVAPAGAIWNTATYTAEAVAVTNGATTAFNIATAFNTLTGFSDKVGISNAGAQLVVKMTSVGTAPLPSWYAADNTTSGTSVNSCSVDWASAAAQTRFSPITEVDNVTGVITVEEDLGFLYGGAEVQKAYTATIEWNALHFDSAASLKQFAELAIVTASEFRTATAAVRTDISSSWSEVDFTGQSIGLWGIDPWGSGPWGGETDLITTHRTYVPRDKQRGNVLHVKLTTDTVFSGWEVAGIELNYRRTNHRSGKL